MTAPTVSISIDRTSLSLAPLTFSGTRVGATKGIVRYIEPALIERPTYMPDSDSVDGSEATSSAWALAILGFDWFPIGAANETAVQAARNEVRAALAQFGFTITTQISGAPAEVWTAAARGSMALGGSDGRTYVDLTFLQPVYSVTIPVHPVPA